MLRLPTPTRCLPATRGICPDVPYADGRREGHACGEFSRARSRDAHTYHISLLEQTDHNAFPPTPCPPPRASLLPTVLAVRWSDGGLGCQTAAVRGDPPPSSFWGVPEGHPPLPPSWRLRPLHHPEAFGGRTLRPRKPPPPPSPLPPPLFVLSDMLTTHYPEARGPINEIIAVLNLESQSEL